MKKHLLKASLICLAACFVIITLMINGCATHITAEDREFLKARQEIFDLKKAQEERSK